MRKAIGLKKVSWEQMGQQRLLAAAVTNRLQDATSKIDEAASAIAVGSSQTNDQIKEATQAIEISNQAIEALAASNQTLNSGFVEISNKTEEVGDVSQRALEYTQQAFEVLNRLKKSGSEITSITALISGIADQISLALNASIEAAKAGDAGRGFGVVAEDVGYWRKCQPKPLKKSPHKSTRSIATATTPFNQFNRSVT